MSLLDLVRMENELKEVFHRDVDLLSKGAIEESHSWIRRKEILGTAEVFYAAG